MYNKDFEVAYLVWINSSFGVEHVEIQKQCCSEQLSPPPPNDFFNCCRKAFILKAMTTGILNSKKIKLIYFIGKC